MSRLQVRILLDTGPTPDEVLQIEAAFAQLGMEASTDGHSYGGPPPQSAFLIVVNAPLMPFLDRFASPDGGTRMRGLATTLFGLRADRRRWGRPHGIKLEDAHADVSVSVPQELPAAAYDALVTLDLSAMDRYSPPARIVWESVHSRWTAGLYTSPASVARRVPTRARVTAAEPSPGQAASAEIAGLCRIMTDSSSPVAWQRASVALMSLTGWSVSSIAHRMMMSQARVRSVLRNYRRDGIASLDLGYARGEGVSPTESERQDAERLARRSPREFGLPDQRWDSASLARVLLRHGLAEDADLAWLQPLLTPPSAPMTVVQHEPRPGAAERAIQPIGSRGGDRT